MIRPAEASDLPRLMRYAEAFLDYHPVTSRFPRNLEAVQAMIEQLMASEDSCVLVHDHGLIGGAIVPLWCSPEVRIATEYFWWAERDGLPLMKAFEDWAAAKGADDVQMLAILGVRDVTPIYDRAGYRPMEISFMRGVQ